MVRLLRVPGAAGAAGGQSHQDVVGVDLGVLHLATLSTGEVIEGPRALRAGLRKLRRLSRHCSRCRRGSRNQRKAAGRLARHHAPIAHLRRDHLHKLTTTLAKNHGVVVIEDLNVRGMSRSARGSQAKPGRRVRAKSGLNRGVLDAGFAEFRRQMEYKCRWYGAELAVADRFFASSKTCCAAAPSIPRSGSATGSSTAPGASAESTATSAPPATSSGGANSTWSPAVRRRQKTPVEEVSDRAVARQPPLKQEPGTSRSPPA